MKEEENPVEETVSKKLRETGARHWPRCTKTTHMRKWSSNRRSTSRCNLQRWSADEKRSTKNWRGWKVDHVQNPFATTWIEGSQFDIQWRIMSRDLWDGKHEIVWAEAKYRDCSMSFLLELRFNRIKLLPMRRLSPAWWRNNMQNQSKISSFDSSVLCCESESLTGQKARITIDAKRGAKKQNYATTLERWQGDQIYRDSQLKIKWTEVCDRYLDYFTTIDISHEPPHHQRHRNENTLTMSCNDPNLQSGHMKNRGSYWAATRALRTLKEEQGRTNSFIRRKERVRQRNLDPKVQEYWIWLSENWRTHFATTES